MKGAYYKIWWYHEIKKGKIVKFFSKPSQGNNSEQCSEFGASEFADPVEKFEGRMSQSLSRTKSRIYELASCNKWEWFFTGTLNPEWHDSANLNDFRKKLSQYIRDCRKKYGTECRFLLIPEQHKSGAWHVHGLLGGFPDSAFRCFTLQEKLPQKIRKRLLKNEDIRDWTGYSLRFGFTTVSPIRSAERCSAYVTKYITKDVWKTSISNGGHMFYASQGLHGKVLAFEGKFLPLDLGKINYEFSNEYVEIALISSLPASCVEFVERGC